MAGKSAAHQRAWSMRLGLMEYSCSPTPRWMRSEEGCHWLPSPGQPEAQPRVFREKKTHEGGIGNEGADPTICYD